MRAYAAWAQAGVQVDPYQLGAARAVLAEHTAQRGVAPGGGYAAVKQPISMGVLPPRDDVL
jgi:hypothetical protein